MYLFTLVQFSHWQNFFYNLIFFCLPVRFELKWIVPSVCHICFRSKPGNFIKHSKCKQKHDLSFVNITKNNASKLFILFITRRLTLWLPIRNTFSYWSIVNVRNEKNYDQNRDHASLTLQYDIITILIYQKCLMSKRFAKSTGAKVK